MHSLGQTTSNSTISAAPAEVGKLWQPEEQAQARPGSNVSCTGHSQASLERIMPAAHLACDLEDRLSGRVRDQPRQLGAVDRRVPISCVRGLLDVCIAQQERVSRSVPRAARFAGRRWQQLLSADGCI